MSSHSVKFVEPDALPDGHSWLLLRDEDGSCYFFLSRAHICPRVLEEGWAAYRKLTGRHLTQVA